MKEALVMWGIFIGVPVWLVLGFFWEPAIIALAVMVCLALWFIGMTVIANIFDMSRR